MAVGRRHVSHLVLGRLLSEGLGQILLLDVSDVGGNGPVDQLVDARHPDGFEHDGLLASGRADVTGDERITTLELG